MQVYLKINFKIIGLILFFLLICIRWPNTIPIDNHDLVSELAIEYYFAKNLYMGIDFIQNVGIFGFINYPNLFAPYLYSLKVCINILIILCFALNLKTENLNKREYTYLLIGSSIILSEWDAFLYCIYLIFILTLFIKKTQLDLNSLIITPLCISILILSKGTYAIISILVLLLYLSYGGLLSWLKISLVIIFIYSIYNLNGIEINHIEDQIKNLIEFSKGYNYAMTMNDSYIFIVPVISLYIFLNLLIIKLFYKSNLNYLQIITLLSVFYIIWKHSIVRSDHLLIFLESTLFLLLYLFINHRYTLIGINIYLFYSTLFLTLICMQFTNGNIISSIYDSKNRFIDNAATLVNINYQYKENKIEFENNIYEENIRYNNCLEKDNHFEKFTYWGYNPYNIILNPSFVSNNVPVSFSSWNDFSKSKSLEFIQSQYDMIVVDYKSIDNNYIYLDDSLTQIEIFNNYSFLKHCGKSELFIKNKNRKVINFIKTSSIKFINNLEIPVPIINSNELLVAELQSKINIYELIRTFFYKPVQYNIVLDSQYVYKFNLQSAKSNFILGVPKLMDAKNSLNISQIKKPKSIKIVCDSLSLFCNNEFEIIFKKGVQIVE